MRVSIFGMGYVGAVSAACFAKLGHDVVGVDVDPRKLDMLRSGTSPIVEDDIDDLVRQGVESGRLRVSGDTAQAVAETDISLISVGTPSARSGAPSLNAIDAVSRDIGLALRDKATPHVVVARSTIPPGTTEEHIAPALVEHSGRALGDGLDVCFNPEFLREGRSVRDFHEPPFTIIGADTDAAFEAVEALYKGVDAPVVRTNFRIAESVKYLCNVYHALKIAFANEAGSLLKSLGMDGREAMEIFCRDTELNISPAYLRPGYAFGGSCLPKDLRGLLAFAREAELQLPLLSQVLSSNDAHIDRAFDMVTRRGRRKVALFGLAFKPGTDDLRESPLVTLAERLIGKGYQLAIHDPHVEASRLMGANRDFIDREIPHFEQMLVADPARALDGAGTIVVGHADRSAVAAIVSAHAGRTIVDLQGVGELEALDGADYEGVCW